ncbi:MAG: hypothetical protein ABI921_07890 [Panacibacter sp.]
MSEFLSKIENFLFDILGLVLPGLIFLLILISPTYFLDISKIPKSDIDSSYILSGLTTVTTILKEQIIVNENLTITIVIILSYLLGHLVKVFSIIKYDFMTVVFDMSINKLVLVIYEFIKRIINKLVKRISSTEMYQAPFYLYLKILFSPFKKTLNKIFTFKSPDYFTENDTLRSNCIALINQRLGTNYPDKWYSLYKFSTILTSQENIRSLAGNFLAKYNLYRSLAFIFIFTMAYFNYFFNASAKYIPAELAKITSLILIASALLWFTFHYKFKRYWTLCGNETLVSLFYFLNKKKINET